MIEELTAKEVLQITAEICEKNECDNRCPLFNIGRKAGSCRFGIAENTDKTLEICKKWKADHTPLEVKFVNVLRIIEDTGNSKQCIYEKRVLEDNIPLENYDAHAESIIKEYCKKHGGFFSGKIERYIEIQGGIKEIKKNKKTFKQRERELLRDGYKKTGEGGIISIYKKRIYGTQYSQIILIRGWKKDAYLIR